MAKLNLPKQIFPLVQIIWEDISAPAQGWLETIDVVEPMMISSVGYLVHETDRHYVLGMDLSNDKQHNQRAQIPKSVVVKVVILKKVPSDKKKSLPVIPS